jgi:hypothetical protein
MPFACLHYDGLWPSPRFCCSFFSWGGDTVSAERPSTVGDDAGFERDTFGASVKNEGSLNLRPSAVGASMPQLACDRCSYGVMDSTNPHLLGTCSCECHAGASKPEPHPEALIRDALSRLMIPDYEASAALDVLVERLEQQRGFLESKHVRVLRLEGELSGMEQVAERKQAELDDLERRLERKDEALRLATEVMEWWPSYTGLPSRVRESEDPTEYVTARRLLDTNENATRLAREALGVPPPPQDSGASRAARSGEGAA